MSDRLVGHFDEYAVTLSVDVENGEFIPIQIDHEAIYNRAAANLSCQAILSRNPDIQMAGRTKGGCKEELKAVATALTHLCIQYGFNANIQFELAPSNPRHLREGNDGD